MRGRVRDPDKPLILVVDDDRTVRLMLRYALEADGYTVIEAKDGARALSEYERLQPDIVLMDAVMPVMDGFTACSRLRELPGGGRTPVLIITALEDEKLVDLAFKSGAADFITKPIHLEALRHRVRRLLRAKQTEVLLEQSEAGAQSVISSALDGIITVNDNGLIQSFNPAAERIFGYTAEEAIGKHVKEMMPGAYRQRDGHIPAGQDAAQKKVKSVSREISGRRKDGSAIPLEVTISGFYTGEQRLITVRDITERKQAEEKLRLAAKVFESIAEGIMVTDIEGTIQSVNPTFTTITGYSEEEVVGKNPRLFESEQPGDERYQNVRASLRETGQWHGEIRARRKNGETFPAWASVNVIKDEQGRGTQYVMVFTDATERVRLQEEQQRLQEQTARLQRLASLSAMSAGIAHEINQPLNSIKVLADGMLYWYKKGRPLEIAKVIENLKKISAQAGRIDEIIKHMRFFAGVGQAAELEPCNLNDAVNGALSILGRQLSSHGIVVKKSLAGNLPEVRGNANRLEEVVINLLVNAMRALDTVSHTEKEISCATRLGKAGGGGNFGNCR
ncbi:MAG: PAS domain S-box protein [Bacillota bacterium]